MILYPNQGAGMCNRLWAAAHLIAHAERSGNPVLLFSLAKYNKYFNGLTDSPFYYHKPVSVRPYKLRNPFGFIRSGSFPPGEISYDEPKVISAEKAAVLLLIGWRFRDANALAQYGKTVREVFRPLKKHTDRIAGVMDSLRDCADNVVGVHIRRGDYRTYRDGLFFYDDEYYSRVMHKISGQLSGRTAFLVSSDESIDLDFYKGLIIRVAPGHELEDLYCLAQCDYIIGPPSTYSSWAAFYGMKPCYHLHPDEVAGVIATTAWSKTVRTRSACGFCT